ncbi:MAG: class II aldolase/adducin family protein [Pseudomonadales bacterium]|nr:class II aldolase/adducin family protein [Pseudomonadales bacterium]
MTNDLQSRQWALKHQIVLGYQLFAELGWGDLGDGHISGRDPADPETLWLLDSNTPFKHASESNLVRLDAAGNVVEGVGTTNWPAFYIHYPILARRQDVNSVAHTHTQYGTPFAAEVRKFEAITQEACIFIDDHDVFDDEEVQVQDTDCGFRIAETLGRNRGLILRNHGLLAVGKTPKESVVWFIMMERVAEAHIKARQPKMISHNAALYAKADLATDQQVEHSFTNLVAHHLE